MSNNAVLLSYLSTVVTRRIDVCEGCREQGRIPHSGAMARVIMCNVNTLRQLARYVAFASHTHHCVVRIFSPESMARPSPITSVGRDRGVSAKTHVGGHAGFDVRLADGLL